jgi:hypothetical protein
MVNKGKNYYTTGLHVFCTTYTVPVCYLLDFCITVHITVHITVRGALPVYVLNIPGCELCWPMVLVQSAAWTKVTGCLAPGGALGRCQTGLLS